MCISVSILTGVLTIALIVSCSRQPTTNAGGPQHLETRVIDFDAGASMVLVYIDAPRQKGGLFWMGSPRSEEGRSEDEDRHRVKLTRGYWIGQTEVTQGQWQAVMDDNPSGFDLGPEYPVDTVSWDDAASFFEKLTVRARDSGLIGPNDRFWFPTEAQWEFACRGGTITPYSTGEKLTLSQENFDAQYVPGSGLKGVPQGQSTPVKTFAPNPWGLYDMHGNVVEWCEDWYAEYDPRVKPAVDPRGPASADLRVLRGGGWSGTGMRSAQRMAMWPEESYDFFGLRVVLITN